LIGPYMDCPRMTRGRRCPMIFRHFLSPKTGCASYLLG
jgi:hypothetical protein